MSTTGVRKRMVDMLINSGGLITKEGLAEIDAYARQHRHTPSERRATVQPDRYLKRSERLRRSGITFDQVRFEDAEAFDFARSLATKYGLTLPPDLQPPRPPESTDRSAAALRAALTKGHDLGSPTNWHIETAGADVRFSTPSGPNANVPALVLRTPEWADPAPRDLIDEHRTRLGAVKNAKDLAAFTNEVLDREWAYLMAEDVGRSNNQTFAVQSHRRKALIEGLRQKLMTLPPAELARAQAMLVEVDERLVIGRPFQMETGHQLNYWPYWQNYLEALKDVAELQPHDCGRHQVLSNRVRDVLRRRTIFGEGDQVDEQDFETSMEAALVYQPKYRRGPGHRVSLAAASVPLRPRYELLTLPTRGLPPAWRAHAGARLFYDGGTIRFDADTAGPSQAPLPDDLWPFVQRRTLRPRALRDGLSLRKLGPEETARSGVPADWNGNGMIDAAPIVVEWWGHCHNEAPANAMSLEPRKPTTVYTADRGVPADRALKTFSVDRVWDIFGALAASQDLGFQSLNRGRPTTVGRSTVAGARHDGHHRLILNLGDRQIHLAAELTAHGDPNAAPRRYIVRADGTFFENPACRPAPGGDPDHDVFDCSHQWVALSTKVVVGDQAGRPKLKASTIELDPAYDGFVRIGEVFGRNAAGAGGRVTAHEYNPAQQTYRQVLYEGRIKDGAFVRKEIHRDEPKRVQGLLARHETTYDSAEAIHAFIMDRPGLPFTFDTSSGPTVWNYAVDFVRLDLIRKVDRNENGQAYTYSTYRLRYDTVGGPSGDVRYIIKRDERGRTVAATAVDPMPDFAFRHDEWVMAPMALDDQGRPAINSRALEAGYLLDSAGRLDAAVWSELGRVLYAALSDETRAEGALLFVDEAGRTLSFNDDQDYHRAIEADRALRAQ